MAKKRTKKQKQLASLKRKLAQLEQRKPALSSQPKKEFHKITRTAGPKPEKMAVEAPPSTPKARLFFYDPALIAKDLRKTAWLTGLILIILGVIYYLLRLNGAEQLKQLISTTGLL